MVHRLLAAALGLSQLPEDARDRDKLHQVADNLNIRHRNAQMAGRASVELHTLIFFKDRSVIADARITKVCVTASHKRHFKHSSQGDAFFSMTYRASQISSMTRLF